MNGREFIAHFIRSGVDLDLPVCDSSGRPVEYVASDKLAGKVFILGGKPACYCARIGEYETDWKTHTDNLCSKS